MPETGPPCPCPCPGGGWGVIGLAGNVGAGGGIPPGIGPGPAPHEPYADTGRGLGICIPPIPGPGPGERFAEFDEEKSEGGVPGPLGFARGGRPDGGPPLLDPAAPGRALGLGSAEDERACFPCAAGFCNFAPDEDEFGGERFAGLDEEDGLPDELEEGVAFGLGFGLRPKKDDLGGDGGRIEGDGIGVVFLGISSGKGILLRCSVRFVSGLYVGLFKSYMSKYVSTSTKIRTNEAH